MGLARGPGSRADEPDIDHDEDNDLDATGEQAASEGHVPILLT